MAVAEFLQSTWRNSANSGASPSGPSLQAVYTTSQTADGFGCTITIGNKVRSQSSGCSTKKAAKQAAAKSLLSLSSDPSGDEGGGGETKAASESNGDIAEFHPPHASNSAEAGHPLSSNPDHDRESGENARAQGESSGTVEVGENPLRSEDAVERVVRVVHHSKFSVNFVAQLNEYAQKQGTLLPPQYVYQAVGAQGPFTCVVTVDGTELGRSNSLGVSTKKEAKLAAAADACRALRELGGTVSVGETKESNSDTRETEASTPTVGNAAAKNCIVRLNEHAQKQGVVPVQYAYQALSAQGPFIAVATTREGEVGRSEQCRNKKEAKLAAAGDACRRLQLLV